VSTVYDALVPLNVTAVAPVKLSPVIVTGVPTGPLMGTNRATTGDPGGDTLKLVMLVEVPAESVTEIGPDVAPDGTVAVICVSESLENVAVVPLNFTDVAGVPSLNPTPVIVTGVPTGPLVGLNNTTTGGKASAGVAIPRSSGAAIAIAPTALRRCPCMSFPSRRGVGDLVDAPISGAVPSACIPIA
jgi:hypothetical protein